MDGSGAGDGSSQEGFRERLSVRDRKVRHPPTRLSAGGRWMPNAARPHTNHLRAAGPTNKDFNFWAQNDKSPKEIQQKSTEAGKSATLVGGSNWPPSLTRRKGRCEFSVDARI